MQSFLSNVFERFGLNAYMQGDYVKAEKWFRKLELREPNSIRVLRNLGIILMAKGDAEGAERYLLREEKLYGRSFHRHAALADIAYSQGKRKEAGKRYSLALAEPESAPGGKFQMARPLMEQRLSICSSDEAFARSRQSMKVFGAAQASSDRGEYEKAIEEFLESARLDETNWPALNNAGSVYFNTLKKPDEAVPLFEKALAISRNLQIAGNLNLAKKSAEKATRGKKR
ncbi:MAG: tetratricopeptide repeat protein [Rectinemataceae bacterium]